MVYKHPLSRDDQGAAPPSLAQEMSEKCCGVFPFKRRVLLTGSVAFTGNTFILVFLHHKQVPTSRPAHLRSARRAVGRTSQKLAKSHEKKNRKRNFLPLTLFIIIITLGCACCRSWECAAFPIHVSRDAVS